MTSRIRSPRSTTSLTKSNSIRTRMVTRMRIRNKSKKKVKSKARNLTKKINNKPLHHPPSNRMKNLPSKKIVAAHPPPPYLR